MEEVITPSNPRGLVDEDNLMKFDFEDFIPT